MSKAEAIKRARRRAARTGREIFIVFESGEFDTATEEDLQGFYLGTEPILVVEPDGMVSE